MNEIEQETDLRSEDGKIKKFKEIFKLPIPTDFYKFLYFSESLLISCLSTSETDSLRSNLNSESIINFENDDYIQVGGFFMNIENNTSNISNIYVATQFSNLNNYYTASNSIFCMVDDNLNLIEEKKSESFVKFCKTNSKSLHLVINSINEMNKKLLLFREEVKNDCLTKERSEIEINSVENFITDGALFLLQRFLVLEKFEGKFKSWTVDINGNFLLSEHIFEKPEIGRVNNIQTQIIRVIRIIYKSDQSMEMIKNIYLPSGHLVLHEWNGKSDIKIHINPLSPIPPTGFVLDLHKKWRNDIELQLKFLEIKENELKNSQNLLKTNEEFKNIVKDYIFILLQSNPNSFLDFSLNYFINLKKCESSSTETDEYSSIDSENSKLK